MALNQAFFWTIFGNIYQLGIGGFLSFEQNSLSFLSKSLSFFSKSLSFVSEPLSFFSKTLEFYNQGGLFSWNLEFCPSVLSFSRNFMSLGGKFMLILVITTKLVLFFKQKSLLMEKTRFFPHNFHT